MGKSALSIKEKEKKRLIIQVEIKKGEWEKVSFNNIKNS